ncbi:nesprin-3 isoform 1-T1 [Anomaloglossus baeobatrachus]
MTQPPQDEFETSLEKAEAWMKEIHRRLKENDNTQGPRSALESRLRETENICSLEGDGKLLLEKVLMKAEVLLGDSSEEEKHEVHLKLAKIKGSFEETTTYMIHCHSRIEWVWLHWNEYLRARDEFRLWVHNVTLTLEPDVELQLGLKEKRWQHEQALVLMKDVLHQSRLVDRLLEEASSLYNRIGDPSVEESVQSAMMAEYIQIKKKAQDRVERLEKIWKDHEVYDGDVSGFKTWLNGVIEKLKDYVGSAADCTESRLESLQEISKDVESGNKQLEILEMKSAEVIKNTSPLGAEKICKELEELRKTLKELKQMNDEEEEALLKTHTSDNAFLLLAQQLEANINEFRKATQRLEESLESGERVKSEDELIALWKTLNATKSALAAEEAKAERVKVQLRDLFRFSKDVQPLSDGVISAMRDYQRAKSKAFKLSTDTESELKQLFQNPLREFLYWKPIAESVLDATAVPVNDGAMNRDALDNIEKLLGESCVIKDKLAALEKKKERIHLVLGDQKTKTLLQDISAAEQDRYALHRDLLERRKSLQGLAELRREFDSALKTLHHQISAIRVKSLKESDPQADIIGKEAQVHRLQILLEELMILRSPIQELISITKSHSPHALRAEQLSSEYIKLQRSLESKIRKSQENLRNHRLFSQNLRDLQRWITATHQTLEIHQNGGKKWGDRDIEALNAELSEKDLLRHLVEAQGQAVMDSSSPEGAALIQQEIKQMIHSWKSLQLLYEQMCSGEKEKEQQKPNPQSAQKSPAVTGHQTSSLADVDTDEVLQKDETPTSSKKATTRSGSISQDGQDSHMDFQDGISTDTSRRREGFPQIGGSSGQDGQVTWKDSLGDIRTSSPTMEGFPQTGGSSGQDGQVTWKDSLGDISTNPPRIEGFPQIGGSSSQDGQVTWKDSLGDISTSRIPRREGFRQIGGSSGQDRQVAHMDPLDDIHTGGSSRKEGFQHIRVPSSISQDRQVTHKDSLGDISINSPSTEGFPQIGIRQDGQVIPVSSLDDISMSDSPKKDGFLQIGGSSGQDGQVTQRNSLDDIGTNISPKKEGSQQIGGFSSINQDGQVTHRTTLDDISTNIFPKKEGVRQIGGSSGMNQDGQVIHRSSLDNVKKGGTSRKEGNRQIGGSFGIGQDGQVSYLNSLDDVRVSSTPRKEGFRQIGQDGQVSYPNSLDDVRTSGTPRQEGFRQIGISQDGQDLYSNSLDDVHTSGTPRKEGFRQIGQDGQVSYPNSLDDARTSGNPRKKGAQQTGDLFSIGQDGQVIHMTSLDDTSPDGSARKGGFRQIGGSSGIGRGLYINSLDDVHTGDMSKKEGFRENGSRYDVVTNSHTEVSDGRPRYNNPPRGLGHKDDAHRVSGNESNSPRTKKQGNKSPAVKRTSGTSSLDHSSYEFRVIDQEDETPGSAGPDGQTFRSAGHTDGSGKTPSEPGFGWSEYRRSGNEEVNGPGGPRGHRKSGDSGRDSSPARRTNPSHIPVTPTGRPAADRGLTSRIVHLQDEGPHRRSGAQISPGRLQITSGFIAEKNMKKKEKSPNNPGPARRNRGIVSLAESVDLVDSPSARGMGSTTMTLGSQRPTFPLIPSLLLQTADDHMKLLLEFELWMQQESAKLTRICATRVYDSDGTKTRKSQLQSLQFRVPQGQNLFESLLRSRSSMTVTEELKLEELRYLWMLYKSKLRDSWKHQNMKVAEEPRGITKAPGGLCSFLHRVCCAALPLQFLLLLLLLLAFLLPLLQETKNCALSNNFARSFNLMLKYDGPPPT